MNPNKALWEKGDFTKIAQTMRESGIALVRTLGITKEMTILDLGCGDGTTAWLKPTTERMPGLRFNRRMPRKLPFSIG